MSTDDMVTKKRTARTAGALYLAWFVTFVLADNGSRPIGAGDSAAIIEQIVASEWRFRASFTCDAVAAVLFLLSAWALYRLLKPLDKDLSLLFVLLNLGGGAVQCISLLGEFMVLNLSGGAGSLAGIPAEQVQALALLSFDFYQHGFMLAQIFWGLWLFPLGYLILKSGFLPKVLGILLIADGFAILIWFLQFFLFPGYEIITYPGLILSLIAELSLALWLLIKGVRNQQPVSA